MAAFSFSSINIPDVLKAWGRFSIGKMVITVLLFCIGYTTYYCRDEIKHAANLYVQRVEQTQVQSRNYDPLKGIPTSVTVENQQIIKSMMRQYLSDHPDVVGMMMYEFVPRGEEILYQGRVLVASVSQNGRNLAERYNATWLPIGSDGKQVGSLLRGMPFVRPPTIKDALVDPNAKTKTNLRLMEWDGIKFMVSIPIADSTYQVRGYLTVLMSRYPESRDFDEMMARLEGEGLEYSRFLER